MSQEEREELIHELKWEKARSEGQLIVLVAQRIAAETGVRLQAALEALHIGAVREVAEQTDRIADLLDR